MNQQARGLGRGLSALLGDVPVAAPAGSAEGVREIEVGDDPAQPARSHAASSRKGRLPNWPNRSLRAAYCSRSSFDRARRAGRYEIVAGERRWRAAQRAQLHRIPAIVSNFDEAGDGRSRTDRKRPARRPRPARGSRCLCRFGERFGHKPEEVGKLVGKSRSHVSNLLRLRDLPESVRAHLEAGTLTMGHARAIASSADAEQLADQIVSKGLSVRQAEALARKRRPGGETEASRGNPRLSSAVRDADLLALERQLGDLLGLKVTIQHKGGAGQVSGDLLEPRSARPHLPAAERRADLAALAFAAHAGELDQGFAECRSRWDGSQQQIALERLDAMKGLREAWTGPP